MEGYYHKFQYINPNKVSFEIGVEVILARDDSLKYRAYDTKRSPEKLHEVVHLRKCPLRRDKKPSIQEIEKQIKAELMGWVPVGEPPKIQGRTPKSYRIG